MMYFVVCTGTHPVGYKSFMFLSVRRSVELKTAALRSRRGHLLLRSGAEMGSTAGGEMPFMRMPHDTMRNGLPGAKADVTHLGKHPVELIQEQVSL